LTSNSTRLRVVVLDPTTLAPTLPSFRVRVVPKPIHGSSVSRHRTKMDRSGESEPDEYPDTVIRRVDWSRDLETVRLLFQGYRKWLADHTDVAAGPDSRIPIGLSQLDQVITGLPGEYGPPDGDVLLAWKLSDVVACGALHRVEPGVGEIKRIYVRRDHFGPVFGPRLVRALLDRAREIGYERVRVDALASMEAAIQYYQEMGFKRIDRYWPHPAAGTLFFEWSAK
jgi:putative acetyltransferase